MLIGSRSHPRVARRGLSLVEMMVGITVGLIVVAGAALVVAGQLGDNRRLLLETQVQQDLRAAADIVTRDLRRAGAWGSGGGGSGDEFARLGIWTVGAAAMPQPYGAVQPTAFVASQVNYQYFRGQTDYGFRLQNGTIQTLLGNTWQDLTDRRVVQITTFNVTPRNAPALQVPCPNDCPGGGGACWPTVTVREFVVDITGQSVADAAVQRSLSTTVRLRNDALSGACP
jgi:type IV pilus assembly protein PilW